jgi:hypothetical protein
LQAIQNPWEIDVSYDEVDVVAMFENCDCLFRIACWDRFVACVLKDKLQIFAGENFILNDQNRNS